MITLKILGSIFIILSSSLVGIYYSNFENYRLNDLSEFKKALIILKSEIEFSHSILSEAFYNISLRISEPISKIFNCTSKILFEKSKISTSDIWIEEIKNNQKNLFLKPEDLDYLFDFGKTLGYLDTKMQLNSINFTIDYIEQKINLLNKSKAKNQKMYKSLGILIGLLTVITLL